MSAVSTVSNQANISDLHQRISKDIDPWKATANKIHCKVLCLECFVLDTAPSDIDLFRDEENEKNEYVYYAQKFKTGISSSIDNLSLFVTSLQECMQKFASSITDPTNRGIFQITITVLNGEDSLKNFEYSLK